MKKKTTKLGLFGLLALCAIGAGCALSGCTAKQDIAYESNKTSESYNANLFYKNDLLTIAPDPSVIAVEENGETVFYLYGTSNDIDTAGYQVFRSKDMVNWDCKGVAFRPEKTSWCLRNLWAPEVLAFGGKYYMVYSAGNYHKPSGRLSLGIAVADRPEGPFEQWHGTNADGRDVPLGESWVDSDLFPDGCFLKGRHLIDASLFVDDDGKLYLYFVCDVRDNPAGSSVWGMELKDFFTPDYTTAKQLTMNKKSSPDLLAADLAVTDEDYTNEAPFMIKNNGTYYLTLSVNEFWNKGYSVKQALSDAPLGDFVKVDNNDGGKLLAAVEDKRDYTNESGEDILIDDYDHMSGTGHHCFVKTGSEWWIVYHAHTDRVYGNSARGVAIDRVCFAPNGKGEEVLFVNGPTYSLQPLPETVSGYTNVASSARVTATNMRASSSEAYLNDGLVRMHNNSIAQEFIAEKTTEVTLEWDSDVYVTALMVYNSFYFDKLWDKVENVTLYTDAALTGKDTYKIKELVFDREWHVDGGFEFVRAGGSVQASFNELPVKKIAFTIRSDKPIAVSDVVVLGKYETDRTSFSVSDYSYINPKAGDRHGWRDNPELDDGVTFDGSFDEEVWQNKEWFSFNSPYNDSFSLSMTSHFGSKGVYFAVDVNDDTVSYNIDKPVYQNSSVEIMVCPDGTEQVDTNCIQIRIAATGKAETWIGLASGKNENDDYDFTCYYLDTMVRTKGKGFQVAYMQEKLDVENVEGYTIEAYLPYEAIGLDYNPGRLKVLPTFNTVLSYASKNRTTHAPGNLSYNNPSQYYLFGADGLELPVQGETLGDGMNTSMTNGFDVSNDTGDMPFAMQNGAEQQFLFVKDFCETKYYFKTKLTAISITNGDQFPKIGLIAGTAGGNTLAFMIDAIGLRPSNCIAVTGVLGTGDWNWNGIYAMAAPTGYYTGVHSAELAVVRDGANFYYFVNGRYAGTQSGVFGADVPSEIGFVTMNIKARFFGYEYGTDEGIISSMLSGIPAQTQNVQVTARSVQTNGALMQNGNYDLYVSGAEKKYYCRKNG